MKTNWQDYQWQKIITEPLQPLEHMAIDQVLLSEVAAGRRQPTLRFWEWAKPAVVLGIFQSVRNEVNPDVAEQFDIEIVRRITGGGAMFVEPGNTVTYSIYAPAELVEGLSFEESYAFFDDFVIKALRHLGIDAWYEPLNDITSSIGKIGGAAQARRGGAVLHHATLAYNIDVEKLVKVLRVGKEKLSDKGTQSAAKRVDPLRSQTGLSRDAIIAEVTRFFAKQCPLSEGKISDEEWQKARKFITEKFATQEWKYKLK